MDIAIIGQACNLPGAPNVQAFAQLLASGKDAITNSGANEKDPIEGLWLDAGGYAKEIYQFDYKLFGISLRDSLIIEPQQRLFLQHCWKALEDAGYNPKATGCKVGVFSTSSDSEYQKDLEASTLNLKTYDPFELEIGSNKEQQSTRTSYLFNLSGPSCGIQSACSSGLMTAHVAMQSLVMGDCDMAIAGGSCLPFPLHQGYHYREGMNWSATGKIRSFDQQADGMIAGFGCVVFVLKTRERALADGDTIYALIKGSAVNNDGNFKSTYTAPSSKAVSANISDLLVKTGCLPSDIGFIEAHGSGTKIGDVIEASALARVFTGQSESTVPVASVKSVIGHLDTVAGLAGLLKAVQQIKSHTIYPAANFMHLNEKISFKNTSLIVTNESRKLSQGLGLVNSLGIGGTNCAMLIAEASDVRKIDGKTGALDIYIGAYDKTRLSAFISNLVEEIEDCQHSFVDVAFTLCHRSMGKNLLVHFNASSLAELCDQLKVFSVINGHYVQQSVGGPNYSGKRIALRSSELELGSEVKLEYRPQALSKESLETDKVIADVKQHGIPQQLEQIWLDNLMLNTIEPTSSFLGEGGHSILALSFVDDIKKYFGIQVNLDWVENYDLFSEQLSNITSSLEKFKESSYVKLLRKSQTSPKVIMILVHASISGYESYKHLSEYIDKDIYLLGVDSHNLYADEANLISNLEQLTDLYSNSIKHSLLELPSNWQSLPLIIGGWSLGGMMANIISKKLRPDFNVSALLAIDSVIFHEKHKEVFWDESLKYFMDVSNLLPSLEQQSSKHYRRLQKVFRAERKMAAEFVPSETQTPLLNIVATRAKFDISDSQVERAFHEAKKDNGWSMLKDVKTYFIPVDHEEIIQPLHSPILSKLINEFIVAHV
jgi:3-oxoacyl-(acyl-carrier-protein) synthase/thioesterase domain-containing protein